MTDRGLGLAITAANSAKLVQSLDLSHCTRLRDAGVIALVQRIGPQLRSLDVSHCRLSDAAFEAIATCCGSSLKSLDCSWNGSGVGERTVHALAKHCGELESLALCGCRARDDSHIKLACACPKLAKLNTRGCEALSEGGIVAALCTLPRIRKLDLCQIHKLSEPSVHVLLGARRRANCMQHTHSKMHSHAFLSSLTVLPCAVVVTARAHHVTTLDLSMCSRLGDDCVSRAAAGFPHLHTLECFGIGLTIAYHHLHQPTPLSPLRCRALTEPHIACPQLEMIELHLCRDVSPTSLQR